MGHGPWDRRESDATRVTKHNLISNNFSFPESNRNSFIVALLDQSAYNSLLMIKMVLIWPQFLQLSNY